MKRYTLFLILIWPSPLNPSPRANHRNLLLPRGITTKWAWTIKRWMACTRNTPMR